MSLLSPWALLLLALIPPIIALYLFKLRRPDYEVASVYLWQRFVRDVEANAPWQRLRRNLLLLLQILFMLAVIFALVRPATPVAGLAGQSLVLVLDQSASMAARDETNAWGQPLTRLEAARHAAREWVTNLPAEARVTIISGAGGQVDLLTSATQDRGQALAAIEAVQPTALNSDLGPALTLAEAIVAREPQAEIVLLSDGAVQTHEPLTPVRLLPFGRTGDNQAISTLLLTPGPGDPTLFVQISNFSPRATARRLVIEADGLPLAAFDLDLPAQGHLEQIIEALPPGAETFEAYLTAAESDPFSLDDRAWLVARIAEPARVTLVTPGNYFVQTALSLLDGQRLGVTVELTTLTPENWSNPAVSPPSADLYIFDRFVPPTLPAGNLFFIAPPQAVPGLFAVNGQVQRPAPDLASSEHPLAQNLALVETQILSTTLISAEGWARPVMAAQGEPDLPLLLAGETNGRRVAVLGFDLHQSDLPLRPAFPLLMANLLSYLAPGSAGLVPSQVAPGAGLVISTPAEPEQARLTWPDGQVQNIETEAGRLSLPPLPAVGLYQLTLAPGSPARFAVNFFNPLESAIAPRPDLALGSEFAPLQDEVAARPPAYREWWRPLAMAALLLLIIEWLVYQRATVRRWWGKLRPFKPARGT